MLFELFFCYFLKFKESGGCNLHTPPPLRIRQYLSIRSRHHQVKDQ